MKFVIHIKKKHVLELKKYRPEHTVTQILGEALELGFEEMDERPIGFRMEK